MVIVAKYIYYTSETFSPTRPHWAELVIESPCMCVCLFVCAIGCSFFLGLSLALRSQDQIPASHWSTPHPSVLLSASVERFFVSRKRDFILFLGERCCTIFLKKRDGGNIFFFFREGGVLTNERPGSDLVI